MSILSWYLKPKTEMAKSNTNQVRIGKYKVSPHAQNRICDPDRNLKKSDMTSNLLLKPDYKSKVDDNHGSYTRVRKKNCYTCYA